MYLSQLLLNPRNPQVNRDLGNAHALHQRVMQGFPDQQADKPRMDWNVLFRQEPDSHVLLVQSNIVPNWNRLPEGYLDRHDIKSLALVLRNIEVGMVLQFRFKANPSKRDKTTGKTVAITGRVERLAWLDRQAANHGFKMLTADCIAAPDIYGRKANAAAPIKIIAALFQGVLEVTDVSKFAQALQAGVGRGRSYGCGLISIAKQPVV